MRRLHFDKHRYEGGPDEWSHRAEGGGPATLRRRRRGGILLWSGGRLRAGDGVGTRPDRGHLPADGIGGHPGGSRQRQPGLRQPDGSGLTGRG